MAQTAYTYKNEGVTDAYLAQQCGGSGTAAPAVPVQYQTITWESANKGDVDAAMAAKGYEFAYTGTAPAAKTILQVQTAALAADASSIPVASEWVDVVSQTLSSMGDSSVGVQVTAIGGPSLSVGQVRVVVNGTGIPADTVVGAAAYDIQISALSTTSFNAQAALPAADPAVAYTFKVQMRATGLGAIVPRAGTRITLVEYK